MAPLVESFHARLNIGGGWFKRKLDVHTIRAIVTAEIERKFPADEWVRMYTDGSKLDELAAGWGAYVSMPNRSFHVKSQAITEALVWIRSKVRDL